MDTPKRLALWTHRKIQLGVAAALLLVLTAATYGYAIGLPFFLDDVIHLRWLQPRNFADIWESAKIQSYYRPVPLTLWKALWLLLGQHNGPVLHAVNVVCHGVNGVLLFALLRLRAPANQLFWVPLGAAVLFVLYPFSYQAVPWVGSLFHVLVLTAMLGALVAALMAARATKGTAVLWMVLSMFCAVVAIFTHEVGLVVVPLLILVLLTSEAETRVVGAGPILRRVWPYVLIAVLGAAVLVYTRQGVGKSGELETNLLNWEARYQNAAFFLQGLAYPVAPLALRLKQASLGLDDLQSIYAVCGLATLAVSAGLAVAGRARGVALALGWFGICAAPAWALLQFSYVIDGPRLLYQASVGGALLWALPLSIQWRSTRASRIGKAISAVVIVAIAAGSVVFLRSRAEMYGQAERAVDELLAIVPPTQQRPAMVVNFPRWLAAPPVFAVGHEGISIVPEYASFYDYYWAHTGREVPIDDVEIETLKRPWQYDYVVAGQRRSDDDLQERMRAAEQIVMTDMATPDVIVYDAGALEGVNVPQPADWLAVYDDKLALLHGQYGLDGTGGSSQVLRVTLIWQSWAALSEDVRTFVHVQAADGWLVAQTDGLPVGNMTQPARWQVGDQWRDTRLVPLPAYLAPGTYTIRAGVYSAARGSRLRARGRQGEAFADESVWVGTIEIR